MVLRNRNTSLPRLSTWQWVRLPLQLHGAGSIWRWWRSPRLVRHPTIRYLLGKRARLEPILNQLKLARTILFKAHLCMAVPTGCFPFGFSYQNCTCISPLNDSLPPTTTTNYILLFIRISKLFIMQLSPFFSVSKYSQHPVLHHPQFTFFQLHYRRSWLIFNNGT